MAYCSLLPTVTHYLRDECAHYGTPDAGVWVCDPPAVYRPRHPEGSIFYQTFEQHFDSYVRAYEERFEPRSGPLRRVVAESVEQFLACGRLQGGFARIRCPACKSEHLLAFSCRARGVCSSCQAKRAALFAEKLTSEILPPVPYRHWTFTIPKAIRGLFERERRLLGLLSRTAYDSIRKSFQTLFGPQGHPPRVRHFDPELRLVRSKFSSAPARACFRWSLYSGRRVYRVGLSE